MVPHIQQNQKKGWFSIKLERIDDEEKLLKRESYIMNELQDCQILKIVLYGYSGEYNVLIMELMGQTLP